jgi:hypothetical protein
MVDDRTLLGSLGWGATLLIVVTTGAHQFLKRRLEARGITPWLLRDTVGATPLLMLGALLAGGGASLGATVVGRLVKGTAASAVTGAFAADAAGGETTTTVLIMVVATLCLATLLIALGVHALGKLFR